MDVQRNEYSTIEEIYKDNKKLIYAFLGDYIEDNFTKEDLASVVWIKVIERGEKFMQMDRKWVKNYLRIMVRNTVSDYFKEEEKRRMANTKMAEIFSESGQYNSLEGEIFDRDIREYLQMACSSLGPDEKELIVLKFTYCMSAREISEVMKISEDAVRIKQFRIIRKLRNEINRLKREDQYGGLT